jgi:hypothetical protein
VVATRGLAAGGRIAGKVAAQELGIWKPGFELARVVFQHRELARPGITRWAWPISRKFIMWPSVSKGLFGLGWIFYSFCSLEVQA